MIDHSLLCERPHFLVVVPVLIKYPLKIWDTFSRLYLLPDLSLQQDLADQVFVIVTSHH